MGRGRQRDDAGCSLQVFDLLQTFDDIFRFGAVHFLDRVDDDQNLVIAEVCLIDRLFIVVLRFVGIAHFNELRFLFREVVGEERIVGGFRIIEVLGERRRQIQSVNDRHVDAGLFALLEENNQLLGIVRRIQHVRAGFLDFGQLRLIVLVVLGVFFFDDHFGAQAFRIILERFDQGDGISVGLVIENAHFFQAQLFHGIAGHDFRILHTARLHQEHRRLRLAIRSHGNAGIYKTADHRNFFRIGNRRQRQTDIGDRRSQNRYDFLLVNQTIVGIDGFFRITFGVQGNEFQFFAVDATLGVDFLDGQFRTTGDRIPEHRRRAAHVLDAADLKEFFGFCSAAATAGQGQAQRKQQHQSQRQLFFAQTHYTSSSFLYVVRNHRRLRRRSGNQHGLQRIPLRHDLQGFVGFGESEPMGNHLTKLFGSFQNQPHRLPGMTGCRYPYPLDLQIFADHLLKEINPALARRLRKTDRNIRAARTHQFNTFLYRRRLPDRFNGAIHATPPGLFQYCFPAFLQTHSVPVQHERSAKVAASLQTILRTTDHDDFLRTEFLGERHRVNAQGARSLNQDGIAEIGSVQVKCVGDRRPRTGS